MRMLVVIARVVGWAWMLMLVIATLKVDDGADHLIVVSSMVLATVWTGVTLWAARRRRRMGSTWFVITDLIVVLLVGGASWAAGADNLFHGGYLIPTLIVAAYGANLYGVVLVASLIAVEQAAVLISWGKGPVPTLSSIAFIVWGLVFGWLFATIRKTDAYRRDTVDELTREREESARRMERLSLANRLHDSALQTLQVIANEAEDADRVRALARRQSRELRDLVESYSSARGGMFKEALMEAACDVEELFAVEISLVVRIDGKMDDRLEALVDAAREAMTNAAKHSGTSRIDVYAAIEDGDAHVYVRDLGRGFDADTSDLGHGIERSIRGRLESVGGEVRFQSDRNEGTEVLMSVSMGKVPV
ncbi:MAG: hypothetical protein M3094_10560, partial [Actinomycetia bacterium]|nr:hypothetical protein [Actinomycetes bacterium]